MNVDPNGIWCELSWLDKDYCHHCRTGARTLGHVKDYEDDGPEG
jgi:hypothetical protein